MNWNDLTKEQKEFLLELDQKYPMPDGATHFDMDDTCDTSWMRFHNGFFYCCGSAHTYCTEDSEEALEDFVQIPDKPWSDSEEEPVTKSNIGKWFRVVVEDTAHTGLIGECVEEHSDGTLRLKFPHGGFMWWSVANLEHVDQASSDGCMIKKPSHYQLLPEYEVKDVIKALLDKVESSEFDMTYYEAGFFQQSMQYFMRFYAKNRLEDLKKGVETMQFVIDSMEERK